MVGQNLGILCVLCSSDCKTVVVLFRADHNTMIRLCLFWWVQSCLNCKQLILNLAVLCSFPKYNLTSDEIIKIKYIDDKSCQNYPQELAKILKAEI